MIFKPGWKNLQDRRKDMNNYAKIVNEMSNAQNRHQN